jgi:uncharacterized delta-60 repeat protein
MSQRSVALRVLAFGSVSTLMLGAVGCSNTSGIAGTENVGSASAAISSGALDTTFNGTGELFSQNSTYDGDGPDEPNGREQYNDVKIQPDGKLVAVGFIMHNASSTPPSGMNLKVARVLPNGIMDPTFGNNNGVTSIELYDESIANSSAILSSGSILVVGQTIHFGTPTSASSKTGFILELNSAGLLVKSFGTGGVLLLNMGSTDDSAEDIVVQPDGKLLIAGYATVTGSPPGPNKYSTTRYPIVARLLPTGAFDTSFGTRGIARGRVAWDRYSGNSENTFHRLVLQPNGSIIGAGHGTTLTTNRYSALLERFTSTGAIDTTFGVGGRIADDYGGLGADYKQAKLLSNGNVVAVGFAAENCSFCQDTVVAEYNSVGQAVSTFGTGGKVSYVVGGNNASDGRSVAIQANGEILVSGRSGPPGGQSGGYVLRIGNSTTGALDPFFGPGGVKLLPGGVSSLALQADQKIVGAGFITYSWNPPQVGSALYRLLP